MSLINNKNIQKIYKQLRKDFKLSNKEINIFLNKGQEQYFTLSPIEFILIDIERNSLIVLNEIKKLKYAEAMGA